MHSGSFLCQLLRINKVRLTSAYIVDVGGGPRNERINLTTLADGIADLLEAILGDLDEVNVLVTLKLRLIGPALPSDLVKMV